MQEANKSETQLPEFHIFYFSGPASPDYRDGIKDLLAEADARGVRYVLQEQAMQPIASVEAVALMLSGITLSIGYSFVNSLAKNLGKEAAPDIWKLIRSHVPRLHQSFVAPERASKLCYLNSDRALEPVRFSELKVRFEIDEGISVTAIFKTDISRTSFERAINAIIEASRPGKRQSQLRLLCQTSENFAAPVLVMFDEDIDTFVRIS